MTNHSIYAIAIGSNQRGRHGSPVAQVRAAILAIGSAGGAVVAAAPIVASAPLGPSIRRFANAVVIVESALAPRDLLLRLKAIEHGFKRRRGQRWGARVIDLDIVLWSGGMWSDAVLTIPHPAFASRRFVLDPLALVAPDWRDPASGRSVRQLAFLARAVDRRPRRP